MLILLSTEGRDHTRVTLRIEKIRNMQDFYPFGDIIILLSIEKARPYPGMHGSKVGLHSSGGKIGDLFYQYPLRGPSIPMPSCALAWDS